MKIKEIEVYPVEIPLKRSFITSRAKQDVGRFLIVRIEAEGGFEGWGEGGPRPHITGETLETAYYVAKEVLAPSIMGMDAYNLEEIHARMERAIELNPSAKCAIDQALHDLLGKAFNIPAYGLLGGSAKKEVKVNAWCGISDLKEAERILRGKKNSGFDYSVKIKVGVDAERDLKLIEKVREIFGGEVTLIADANQAWSLEEALRFLRRVDDGSLNIIEQPLHRDDLKGMAVLAEKLSMDVMADESLWGLRDAYTILRLGAATMFNIKPIKCGGLYPARKILSIAEASGITCMVGCTVETSISASAEAHLAAASQNVKYLDLALPEENLTEDVAEGFTFEKGRVHLKDEPGLGVKVREKVLEKYLVDIKLK